MKKSALKDVPQDPPQESTGHTESKDVVNKPISTSLSPSISSESLRSTKSTTAAELLAKAASSESLRSTKSTTATELFGEAAASPEAKSGETNS